jgi:iron-sulfur cluster repair protein YtfE (RIC family)
MRRHDSLIPLTHDHHHALAQVRRLRSAAAGSDEDRSTTTEEFLDFFRRDTIEHFREEEEVVFPLVADVREVRETLARVLLEHVRLHALVNELTVEHREGSVTSTSLLTVATTLEDHIRFEEKVVFPLIEEHGKATLGSISLPPRERTARPTPERAAPA